jgi:hypothetical protein
MLEKRFLTMLDFQQVIKNSKKSCIFLVKNLAKIFGLYCQTLYLCTRFSTKSGQHNKSFDSLYEMKFNTSKKYFENFSRNIWWNKKLDLSLQSVSTTKRHC